MHTQREEQVLALIAQGKSNREIAAMLGISPATSSRHVANLLRKLRLANRTQLAIHWLAHIQTAQPTA